MQNIYDCAMPGPGRELDAVGTLSPGRVAPFPSWAREFGSRGSAACNSCLPQPGPRRAEQMAGDAPRPSYCSAPAPPTHTPTFLSKEFPCNANPSIFSQCALRENQSTLRLSIKKRSEVARGGRGRALPASAGSSRSWGRRGSGQLLWTTGWCLQR